VNCWSLAMVVLLAGGAVPGLVLGARDDVIGRLIGLELTGAVATAVLVLVAHETGPSFLLTVPLVFVLVSFAGTLVFTRLLGPRQ